MISLMKSRVGFVTAASKEGHIQKKCFSSKHEDPAKNIYSARNIVRMILFWAYDSQLMDDGESFREGWNALGELALNMMEESGPDFLQQYEKPSKKEPNEKND